jgi:hypothetical protein
VARADWGDDLARALGDGAFPVLVVDPDARLAVISDVDDTVIETGIARGLEFLRLTLFTSVNDRTPLPGAAELHRALTAPRDASASPVFYLSTSPWNLHELLTRFLVLRGFPAGPLLLTDWGPEPDQPVPDHRRTAQADADPRTAGRAGGRCAGGPAGITVLRSDRRPATGQLRMDTMGYDGTE